jgi:hypothetical protein
MWFARTEFVEVTNRHAREMLDELARLGRISRPRGDSPRFSLPHPDQSDSQAVEALRFTAEDAAEMRERLELSGLDTQLPGGLNSLPDIAEAAPVLLQPLLRLGLPRNFRQLAGHVARNLDWYLDPEDTPVRLHRFAPWLSLLSMAGSGWFFWASFQWLVDNWAGLPGYANLVVAILAMCVPTWVLIVFGIVLPVSQLKPTQQDRFNARQLYYYLLDSYADWD